MTAEPTTRVIKAPPQQRAPLPDTMRQIKDRPAQKDLRKALPLREGDVMPSRDALAAAESAFAATIGRPAKLTSICCLPDGTLLCNFFTYDKNAAYDTCINRAASAYDRDQPGLATAEAARVSDVRNLCLSYGIAPQTLGYRECVSAELDRRAIPSSEVRYVPNSDRYGFYYDADGNVRDRNGELIRVVPRGYR